MAQRRMFNKTIVTSGQFIKMPATSQLLYFHLGMQADDDGVVEAFPIIRMIGAAEDDLKILAAKKFVVILNEDLVTFISNWSEHNQIRADRKNDSKYKDLLMEVVKDVKLLESKKAVIPLPNDGQMSANVPHRLGKVRLGKVREKKERKKEKMEAIEIIKFLNRKVDKDFEFVDSNINLILKLFKNGYTPEIIRQVIARQVREWYGDPVMHKNLRPMTLFRLVNFVNYRGELKKQPEENLNVNATSSTNDLSGM